MTMNTRVIKVYDPDECAARLGGISVSQLVAILKAKTYDYVELTPGSKPWGRGRQSWGMTDDQIAALVAGQTRQHPAPKSSDAPESEPVRGLAALGHDGKSRIRYPRGRGKG